MQPLLIFGGTFDPVHRGHVAVASEVAQAFGAAVHLMPAALPPHRSVPGASAAERLHMLRLAIAGHPELRIDDRELRREGPSWTVETLREVRDEVGPAQSLVILVGADAFARFDTWREWRTILDLAHVLVLTRPGAGRDGSAALQEALRPRWAQAKDDLLSRPAGRVLSFSVTPIPVSASEVRRRLATGEPVEDLLPAAVLSYLRSKPIYRSPG